MSAKLETYVCMNMSRLSFAGYIEKRLQSMSDLDIDILPLTEIILMIFCFIPEPGPVRNRTVSDSVDAE